MIEVVATLIGRAFRACIISYIVVWLAVNVFSLVFSFWTVFTVLSILLFILGL